MDSESTPTTREASQLEKNQTQQALEKILPSFKRYYTIKTEGAAEPFTAEAEFLVHGEQYMLVKAAKIADIDSREYLYFYTENSIDLEKLEHLCQKAWGTGTARLTPYYGLKNADVGLFVICNSLTAEAEKKVKKQKFYKSYKFSFYGMSRFKLVTIELDKNRICSNYAGSDFKKLVSNILFPKGGKEKK